MNKAVIQKSKRNSVHGTTVSASPHFDARRRLAAWDRIRGMWKNRKPDPNKN